jgi:hypothetical protein
MNRLLFVLALLIFGINSFGQNCPEIDSVFLIKKAKKTILKTNKDLYKTPPVLNINWKNCEILCGKSVNCENKTFDFILIGFVDSKGGYAIVIYEYKSKKKLLFQECKFSIDNPKQILDSIKKDPQYYWGCNV